MFRNFIGKICFLSIFLMEYIFNILELVLQGNLEEVRMHLNQVVCHEISLIFYKKIMKISILESFK